MRAITSDINPSIGPSLNLRVDDVHVVVRV